MHVDIKVRNEIDEALRGQFKQPIDQSQEAQRTKKT